MPEMSRIRGECWGEEGLVWEVVSEPRTHTNPLTGKCEVLMNQQDGPTKCAPKPEETPEFCPNNPQIMAI